jgi:hypothetical protein
MNRLGKLLYPRVSRSERRRRVRQLNWALLVGLLVAVAVAGLLLLYYYSSGVPRLGR